MFIKLRRTGLTTQGLTCLAYNTSKSALLQMCRSAAAEWGAYGIRVNVSALLCMCSGELIDRRCPRVTFARP